MTGKGKKSGGGVVKKSIPAEKENAPLVNGTKAKPVDRYADIEKKRSAFAELSSEAKVRAAAAPPVKANAVPVGMRKSDKKNRSRYSDGRGNEHVSIHNNGDKARKNDGVDISKMPEKTIRQMKEEIAKNGGKKDKKTKTVEESTKKNEKRKRQDEDDEVEEINSTPKVPFFKERLQQLANAAMENEIARNKFKRARNAIPSDVEESDDEGADALALVPLHRETAPQMKKRKLASGRVIEHPEFEVQEVAYTVEEPSDEDDGINGRKKKKTLDNQINKRMDRPNRTNNFNNVDFAAFDREMAEEDPYDEEADDDFEEEETGDEDEDEEEEEVLTDEMSDEDVEINEEEMSDEEVTDEELVSSEIDEEDARIRPEDILRTINFDEEDGEEESDEDEEEEEDVEGMEMHGCCDNSDCDENGEDNSDEDEYEEVEGDTSDSSSHISDDSYQEAFVDADMANKSVTMIRQASKKAANSAANIIDFTAFPFKDSDSAVSSARGLDWLLSPCDVQTFFDDFFQSTSLVVKRKDKKYYGNLFSTGAMTSLLRENCLEYGVNVNVALYENGVRTTHNSTGRAYPLAIGDAIRSGCSVQLTNPQTYSKEIWYLCDTLQEMFHCFVGANTYITPAGASGFAPHWDEIDAFLLQVEGRKYWRVWAPESAEAELPLESSGNFTEADMEGRKPAFEGWIETGDMLYIPRGFIHQARTDASVHSLHVTISVGRQWTFSNLLQKLLPAAMDAFTADRVKLRKQLPAGLLDMTGVAEMPGEYPMEEAGESKLTSVLDRHMSKFRFFVAGMRESGVDLMAREFMRTALPPFLSNEEKQLSVWGNDGADLFEEKGASRITSISEVRFIKRHGQRLLFESADAPFVVHRMANARVYEGADERTFTLTLEEEPAFADLLAAYPDWTTVSELKMKKKARISFLTKLFNHGLIMVRSA